MSRRGEVGKRVETGPGAGRYDEVLPHFREASWDEALDLVARRLSEIHAEGGPAGDRRVRLGEVLQRGGLPLPEADPDRLPHQQRRPLHPAVPRLQRRGAVRGHRLRRGVHDVRRRGQRRRRDHHRQQRHRQPPGRASFFKQARRRGTKIIYIDPRADRVADHADIFCQLKPGTDVAFYNGGDARDDPAGAGRQGVRRQRGRRTTTRWPRTVADYPPERAAQITGVAADVIREVARIWGEARAGIIFWGMGISQHTTGTDNARCLIALCAITGNVGKPGSRSAPAARAEQRAGRVRRRPDPDVLPRLPAGGRRRTCASGSSRPGARALTPKPGLTVTEIIGSVLHGRRARDVHDG